MNETIKPKAFTEIDQFIEYMKLVENLNENIDTLKPEYDYIAKHKKIIEEQKIKIPK